MARLHPSDLKALRSLTLLVSLVYLPGLIGVCFGTFPLPDDAMALYWPWRDWLRSELLKGQVPLWNPNLYCGQPAAAVGQSILFYPPSWLLLPLSSAWAAVLETWAHNLMLAAGGYFLARAWGLSRTSSWVAAALIGLSNAVAAHLFAGHVTWHNARAYAPWILLVTLLYLRSGSTRHLPVLIVLFWLQFTAGYPPLSLLTFGACAYLALGRALLRCRMNQRPALPRSWPLAAITVPIGIVLLCAASLLPFREITKLAVHGSNMSFEEATMLSASAATFARLLLPDFFGGNDANQWSIGFSPHEEAAYVGIVALPLALLAPLLWRKQEKAPPGLWILWASLIFAAVLALGHYTLVYGWIWQNSNFFRSLRAPARWMEIWALVAPLLAAAGFELWLRRGRPGRKWVLALAVLAGACLLLTVGVFLTLDSPFWRGLPLWNRRWLIPDEPRSLRMAAMEELQQAALLAGLTGTLICALGAAMLARWNRAQNPIERQKAIHLVAAVLALDVTLAFLKSTHIAAAQQVVTRVLWPSDLTRHWKPGTRWTTDVPIVAMNQGMHHSLPLYNGYDPLSTGRFWDFATYSDGPAAREWLGPYEPERLSPLLRVVGVTHTIQFNSDGKPKKLPVSGDVQTGLEAKYGRWALWRHEGVPAWPLAYETNAIWQLPTSAQLAALDRLARRPWHADYPVTVEPGWGGAGHLPTPADGNHLPAPVPRIQTPTYREWQVSGRGAAFVHSEALTPGWKAYTDGRPADLSPGNYLFRVVHIPRGSQKVTLVFDSSTQRTGLFFTLFGLMGVGVWTGAILGTRSRMQKL